MSSALVDVVPVPCPNCGEPHSVAVGDTCVSEGVAMASQPLAFRVALTQHPLVEQRLWLEGRLTTKRDVHFGRKAPPYLFVNIVADDGSASRRLFMLAPREARRIAWALRRWAGLRHGPTVMPRPLLRVWYDFRWALSCAWWGVTRRVRNWLWEEH